jgi:putative tryptophan/tyrosine transport system substrate-binding protein
VNSENATQLGAGRKTMRRREFTALLGGAAAWPLAAHGQQSVKPVIGYLTAGAAEGDRDAVPAFKEGLGQTGFVEGKNVAIEYRWANGRYDRVPDLVTELIARPAAVIATITPVAALAAKRATTSIPIVFVVGSDPIKDGLVASINHPGGNITGATFFNNLLDAKRLDLLHQLAPTAKVVAALMNPKNANVEMETREAQEAAHSLGLELIIGLASAEDELDKAIESFAQQHSAALLVGGDIFLSNQSARIASLALRHGFPTCFPLRSGVAAGGLMSYGANITDSDRQAGIYVGRILKGEKPGDLPVQQPTKFEFVINMKTAKALGLDVPASVQLLADEVIE